MTQPYPNPEADNEMPSYSPNGAAPIGTAPAPTGSYQPIATPPPEKSSGGQIVTIIIGVIVALFIAGTAIAIIVASNHTAHPTTAASASINADPDSLKYLTAVEQGDYDAAYAMMTSQAQSKLSQDAMEADLTPYNLSTSCTITWTSVPTDQPATKQVRGTLACPHSPAPSYNILFNWVKQTDDSYKLQGFFFT